MNYSNGDCRLRRALLPSADPGMPATLAAPASTPPLKQPGKRRRSPRKLAAAFSLLLTCCAQAGDLPVEKNAAWQQEAQPGGLSAVTTTLLVLSGAVAAFGFVIVHCRAADC